MKSYETGQLHINQFNALFTNNTLLNAVVNTPPLEFAGVKLSFTGLEIHKPFITRTDVSDRRLLPRDCREQSLTYGGNIFLKMKLEYGGRTLFDDYKNAGVFPVMMRSSLCHLTSADDLYKLGEDPMEPGGYFIIGGFDKLIRFHIATKRNILLAQKKKSKDSAYTDFSVSIRSVAEDEVGQKNEIRYCADGNVHLKVYVNKRAYMIPAVLLLRAFSNCTDEEIFVSLGSDQRILTMLAKMKEFNCYSQKECLEYLGTRFKPIFKIEDSIRCGFYFINSYIFVHLEKLQDKFNLMIEAIKKLIKCYDGKIQPDDIDSPGNFELYTELQLFPLCFKEKLSEIKRSFNIKMVNVLRNKVAVTDSTTSINTSEMEMLEEGLTDQQVEKLKKSFDLLDINIGDKLHRLVSGGNLTTNTCSDLLQTSSFSILADRVNFWRFTSHLESVSRGAYFSNLKITSIRKLKPESWGFFCPLNTPDGAPCGLLFHLSKTCFVSDKALVLDDSFFFEIGVVPAMRGFNEGVPVFYNGKFLGTTHEAANVARMLREYRAVNDLCYEVCHEFGLGIDELVCVSDTPSSLYRPVFNIKTQRSEWIGIKEQVYLNIRLGNYVTKGIYNRQDELVMHGTDEQTLEEGFEYRELDNQNIFSSIAACAPFSDYNPSPRSIYQCQMAKQAMGIPALNPQFRTDVKSFYVNYLQTPMVKTGSHDTFERYPIGFNCVVAVISYTAHDMEDAVVINKSAIERGLFSAFVYKTEKYILEKNSIIDYTPFKGTRIETDDIILKYIHPEDGVKIIRYQGSETGYVDTVRVFMNETLRVTVTLRILRNPNIGDKFCSRHGQKGVCSAQWAEIDMPFTEYGLRPDIIINPHAFPSRMTIGMLLESLCGKSAMQLGKVQDSSPFEKNTFFDEEDPRSVGAELKDCGFNYYGNEPMYSGVTGTELKTDIFIGSVYYQRLRHMVNDKYQVRTSGAVVATTRQPVGGRKNKGGIRFGEMEKDALIAHGTSHALRDRLMNSSDRADFTYCCDCKNVLFTGKDYCACGGKNLKTVTLPFVFKYLCYELFAMNIKLKLDV